ncbi:hypothetical protein BRPE64_ACDS16380 [Caballeronia insecticola]|uniref:Uncharacterized protein n=1 Tax=Caballeronia insecticola TaxID=758793 RepID=R4WYQ6_9BURK|nr:hypothetical protein BRPE64_ACDS16380 [Caballeronia insecticola]
MFRAIHSFRTTLSSMKHFGTLAAWLLSRVAKHPSDDSTANVLRRWADRQAHDRLSASVT